MGSVQKIQDVSILLVLCARAGHDVIDCKHKTACESEGREAAIPRWTFRTSCSCSRSTFKLQHTSQVGKSTDEMCVPTCFTSPLLLEWMCGIFLLHRGWRNTTWRRTTSSTGVRHDYHDDQYMINTWSTSSIKSICDSLLGPGRCLKPA